jgi:hypothetical protein
MATRNARADRAFAESVNPKAQQEAWRKHSLETNFAVWHLSRGGVLHNEIAGLSGIHPTTVREIIGGIAALHDGPIRLGSKVRCSSCGALLFEIPCRLCGWTNERYTLPSRGTT